jgi:hypothetical protein
MTILARTGPGSQTDFDCRFVEGVECVLGVFDDFPSDGKSIIETCKACGHINADLFTRLFCIADHSNNDDKVDFMGSATRETREHLLNSLLTTILE